MRVITSIIEMQQHALAAHRAGKSIALVPTMGYLHEGHASLIRAGRCEADLLITSIFVNPTQFAVGEDLDRYPRDLTGDCALAESCGVDIVFAPTAAEMYPRGYQTYVTVEEITKPLCGASRPGHFRGVTTVVTKLFTICQPDLALFGKKDFQQLAVIRQMTADLHLPVRIIGMPIVREADGLALSSRNVYLSATERQSALCLHRSLATARALFNRGETSIAALHQAVSDLIATEPSISVDYIEFRHSQTLSDLDTATPDTLLALAVRIGTTRLIDNCILGEET
jgi:pantoate--beta-alanine ligase